MKDYSHYLPSFKRYKRGALTSEKNILKFLNFVQTGNTPLKDWHYWRLVYKRTAYKQDSKTVENQKNWELKQFIDFCIRKEKIRKELEQDHTTPTKIWKDPTSFLNSIRKRGL